MQSRQAAAPDHRGLLRRTLLRRGTGRRSEPGLSWLDPSSPAATAGPRESIPAALRLSPRFPSGRLDGSLASNVPPGTSARSSWVSPYSGDPRRPRPEARRFGNRGRSTERLPQQCSESAAHQQIMGRIRVARAREPGLIRSQRCMMIERVVSSCDAWGRRSREPAPHPGQSSPDTDPRRSGSLLVTVFRPWQFLALPLVFLLVACGGGLLPGTIG